MNATMGVVSREQPGLVLLAATDNRAKQEQAGHHQHDHATISDDVGRVVLLARGFALLTL